MSLVIYVKCKILQNMSDKKKLFWLFAHQYKAKETPTKLSYDFYKQKQKPSFVKNSKFHSASGWDGCNHFISLCLLGVCYLLGFSKNNYE